MPSREQVLAALDVMWAQPNVRVDYERYVWHPAQYQQDSWTNIFIRAYFLKFFGISRIEAAPNEHS